MGLVFLSFSAYADRVKVRLFSNTRIEGLNVSFDLGTYHLFAGDSLLEANLGEGLSVILQATSTGVKVDVNDYEYGVFPEVCLRATDTACILCLNPRNVKQRTYEGDLIITTINATALKIINDVDFETYLAGVVQSEIYGSYSDIFRIQAIISRTWAQPCKRRLQFLRPRALPGLAESLRPPRYYAGYYPVEWRDYCGCRWRFDRDAFPFQQWWSDLQLGGCVACIAAVSPFCAGYFLVPNETERLD